MLQKINLSTLLVCSLTLPLIGKRHANIKKTEPVETQKISTQSANQTLRSVLSKQTKNMTFAEAQQAKEHYVKEKDNEMVIKCGQRLLAVGGDQEVMRIARLELAELFLEKKNYAEAEKYAQEYQKYYPGAGETKRADYIAIQANYLSKLTANRDQQKTRATIDLAKQFLEKHPQDKEYAQEVHRMMHDCYASLIESEIHIITTQLNTYNHTKKEMALTAAQKRFAYLKEQYLPHAPEISVASLESRLAQLTKVTDSIKNAPVVETPTATN